ncbi:PREDICTED: uncharacterized protein LOC104808460 [Tarenaya hassleriana]|uniref:uncharacterized protein LOC104808460 n=1 Tax=Tarenaya hassleriana TaxID=28532 RepID=UPI00053C1CA9|nr:PREDICTED: uncharacterized protein LOC104808460 [Tarenaya hassleriana]
MDAVDEKITIIYFKSDGKWVLNGNREYEWVGKVKDGKGVIFMCPPTELKYKRLVEELYSEMEADQSKTDMKLSYLPAVKGGTEPIYISNDKQVLIYLLDKMNGGRSMLHVEIEKARSENEFRIPDLASCVGPYGGIICVGYKDCDVIQSPNFKSKVGSNSLCIGAAAAVEVNGNATDVVDSVNDILADTVVDRNEIGTDLVDRETGLDGNEKVVVECATTMQAESTSDMAMVVVEDSLFCTSVFEFTDGLNIDIGYEFDNKQEAQEYIRKGSVKACFSYVTVKSDKKLWEIRCKFAGSGCNWKLRIASIPSSNRFSVRTHNPIHRCRPVSEEAMKGTSNLVRYYLKEEYAGILEIPNAPELVRRIKTKYGATVSYLMALRGKHSAEKEIRGNHVDHYMRLPGWMYMLRERNPGSIVRLELDNDQKSFKYLFVALSATIKGWKYMRKVVAVDATFLSSEYKGALVVATAQDGEHHQYPLAWGVIDREKDASWRWFMNRLSEVIPDGPDVVVISDRYKSILKAVREVYKQAYHAYTEKEFEELYSDLKNRYPKAAEYMEKEELAPEKWARCKFRTERYNILTTNGAESINSVLKKAKRYPLLSLLDICVAKTVEWFSRYRVEACGGDDSQKLTPYVYKALHERFEKACTYEVIELNRLSGMFEARDEKGRRHLVNLGDRTSSCRKFDVDSDFQLGLLLRTISMIVDYTFKALNSSNSISVTSVTSVTIGM